MKEREAGHGDLYRIGKESSLTMHMESGAVVTCPCKEKTNHTKDSLSVLTICVAVFNGIL